MLRALSPLRFRTNAGGDIKRVGQRGHQAQTVYVGILPVLFYPWKAPFVVCSLVALLSYPFVVRFSILAVTCLLYRNPLPAREAPA